MAISFQDEDLVVPGVGYFTSPTAEARHISRRDLLRVSVWGIGSLMLGLRPHLALAQTNGAGAAGGNVQLIPDQNPIHPKVYATPESVKHARENVTQFDWARKMARSISDAADLWLARDEAWIKGVVPGPNACYASGATGCPICGGTFGPSSFEKPNHVTCINGHVLPDADHPDPGTGYHNPDGRIHYFVGVYNAWVIDQLTSACSNLAHSYALTSDERYAARAGFILDALATIYPTSTKGTWDYPSDPPSGRFNRPWFQVARTLVIYVEQYDHIYHSPSLDVPSAVAGMTRRQNIEENFLKNGAKYCYDHSKLDESGKPLASIELSNGSADYIRGALAVGICLDIPEYVSWAVDGPAGILVMLDNNVGRDGSYYETSAGYAGVARSLYSTYAEPLYLYRSSAYPNGVNLYEHPKFRSFLTLHNTRQLLVGHQPTYGDTGADIKFLDAPDRPTNANDNTFIERLYVRAKDEAEKQKLGQLLNWVSKGDTDDRRLRESAGDRWLLFFASPIPKTASDILPSEFAEKIINSTLLGQKGIAILRATVEFSAAGQQGLLLRYGPSLHHGHYDDLNINFVSHGYEMTYDIGYGLGSLHSMVGWVKQTASHNLVMVDETPQSHGNPSGGDLHLFSDLPGVKLTEASSEGSYASLGVTQYRRTLALIDGYAVDIFRVRGGKQHDYLLHTLGKSLNVQGVPLGPVEPGSLAGPDIDWGKHELADGDIEGHPNQPYWNPPPGNGYGFMVEPRRGNSNVAWIADWNIDDATGFQCHVPAETETQVITTWAPGVTGAFPKANILVRRRKASNNKPLASAFVSILEPYRGKSLVQGVETLAFEGNDKKQSEVEPVALRVSKGESNDWIYSSDDAVSRRTQGMRVAARFAHARVQKAAAGAPSGELTSLSLVGGRDFEGFGWQVTSAQDGWYGKISSVDSTQNVLTTKTPLPEGEVLRGQIIILSNAHTTHNSPYRILRVERVGRSWQIFTEETSVLGRGIVQQVKDEHTLVSSIPHEYARKIDGEASGFFTGKQIRTANGLSSQITNVNPGPPFEVSVASTQGFKVGDAFFYQDVQVGDAFQVFATTTIERVNANSYKYRSLAPVRVKAPKGVQVIAA